MFGFGRSKLMLGGSTLSWSAIAVLKSPAAPAAPLRWPMFDFTDPSAIAPGATSAPENTSPNALDLDDVADARRRAVALHSEHFAGDRPACARPARRRAAGPTGLGAVMPLPLPSLAPADPAHDRVDAVAVALGVGQALEQEQRPRPRP